MNLKDLFVGKVAKANHPITCINPEETFMIVDVKCELHPVYNEYIVSVRGEKTCWFGRNMWELVE